MLRHRQRRMAPVSGRSQLFAAIFLAVLPLLVVLQGLWIARHPQTIRPRLPQIQLDRVKCDYCGGTGSVRDPEHVSRIEPCPICFGVGGHQVRKMDSKDVLCPACGGMGRVIDVTTGYARPCMRCGGRGLIRTNE